MTRARPVLTALAAMLLLAQRTSAHASVRLVYVRDAAAVAVCPDERALRRAIELRLGYDPFLPWGSATIVVRFDHDRPGFVARVELVDKGASRGVRTLRSDDPGCGGLVDAAALAVSIALDAQGAPTPPIPPDGTFPAGSGGGGDPVEAPPSPAGDAATSPAPPPPVGASMRFRPFIGLDALVSAGSAPSLATGLAAWGRLQTGRWSLGVEARADLPSAHSETGGTVKTWLVAGGLAPCFHLGWAFGCAVGELGWLQGWGVVNHSNTGSALFAAAGPRVGVEIPVTRWASVRLRADFLANLSRVRVDLNNNPNAAWQAPPVTGTLGGGLAIRFP